MPLRTSAASSKSDLARLTLNEGKCHVARPVVDAQWVSAEEKSSSSISFTSKPGLAPSLQLTILLTTHTSISGWGLALNGQMTQNHDAAPD